MINKKESAMLKYKCLVLDHDDTVVKSTPEIHFLNSPLSNRQVAVETMAEIFIFLLTK